MRLLRELVSQRLGIQVRTQDVDRLQRTLRERCERLRLSDLDQYAKFLQTMSPASDREWEQLATLLTTGETFFFRGKAHTDDLRNHILPELIRSRQTERALRIWSAGCSSGEEAYTIAIMLDELLAARNNWSISLLATDINVEALSKARRGVYTDWSFRQVDPTIREKYFHGVGKEWELEQRIKDMVTFERLNLLTEAFPTKLAGEMDLIVCRNVFIYFSAADVASIVKKFSASLRSGGYLMTGHGELHGQNIDPLVKRVFSESVVLQRDDSPTRTNGSAGPLEAPQKSAKPARRSRSFSASDTEMSATTPSRKQAAPGVEASGGSSIEQIEELLKHGSRESGLEKAMLIADEKPGDAEACCLIAQGHADLGDHKQAIDWCQKAMAIDSFAVRPQYLLANIAEAEGRHNDAKAYLRKVVYLDPSHVAAQLTLAGLYEREGELQLARKTRLAVVETLKSKPDSYVVECHEPLTVGELFRQLNQAVAHG